MDNHQAENLSDAELVKLSIQDDTFFAIIISRYKEHFFYFLKRSMSMPDDEIEDVIQNSFIKIYYHLNDFDQDLKFSSWAYRIIHNEAISELRRKHHSNVSLSPDFDIPDDLDVSEETDKILEKEKVALVLTAIAAITLLVSGIGIMNVMFVTVAERTKEIGISKAIGGKQSDILMQFLLESVILSMVGGLIGVIIGQGAIPIISYFNLISIASSWTGPVIGFTFSVFVGVFFGFYPALKASRLDPVDALRSE